MTDMTSLEYIQQVWEKYNGTCVESDSIGDARYRAIQMYITMTKEFGESFRLSDELTILPNYHIISFGEKSVRYRMCFELHIGGILRESYTLRRKIAKLIPDEFYDSRTLSTGSSADVCIGTIQKMEFDADKRMCSIIVLNEYTRATMTITANFDKAVLADRDDIIQSNLLVNNTIEDDISSNVNNSKDKVYKYSGENDEE